MNAMSPMRRRPDEPLPLSHSELHAENDFTALQRAAHCTRMGCYEQALEAWKEITRLHPECAYAHLNLGGILTELHCWPEALNAFHQAARLQPNLKEAHYGLGMCYGQIGQFGPAIEAFRQAFPISPEVADRTFQEERDHLHASLTPLEDANVTSPIPEHEPTQRSRRAGAKGEKAIKHDGPSGFWRFLRNPKS